jgi:N-formylglutamate amidohydrolase
VTDKFIYRKYLKYNKGNGYICCHVDALHAVPPTSDLFTDRIVTQLIDQTGCAGIIGTISRKKADLNRSPNGENDEALHEYRHALKDILRHLDILDQENQKATKPYLHLGLHGMKDVHHGPCAIEIGTLRGRSCSADVRDWFQEIIIRKSREIAPRMVFVFDKKFKGHKSIGFHRLGNRKDYPGYGRNFHSFQIEISRTLREKKLSEIVALFSHVILQFQETFVKP